MTNLNPTTEEVAQFIRYLKYPKLASYVVNKLIQRYEATREEAVRMWENYRAKQAMLLDERVTFRGLTEHEKDVLRVALGILASDYEGVAGYKDKCRSARSMLDQNMVENFLWKSGSE